MVNGLFSFELGLTARDFNGAVTVTGPTIIVEDDNDDCPQTSQDNTNQSTSNSLTPTGKIKTDKIEPMLYVATNIGLPLTGLRLFAQGDYLLIDKHSLYDYQVGLTYDLVDNTMVDFNLTLGYQAVKMAFEDFDNLYTDLKFKGAFVGVVTHF